LDLLVIVLLAMGSAYPEEYRRFLKKLRAARVDAGLTQVDVAKRLKKPQSFVSKFETGERRVDPVELCHLAQLYGKPASYFFE
jgi:transcriptional regulator with XRE-family HTH domain